MVQAVFILGTKKCPFKVNNYWYYYTCEDVWEYKYQVHTHSVWSAQLTMKICQW